LSRCKVASHANHKAELQSGHGCIPSSVNDRSNTKSAYLEPPVSSNRFLDSINDLADQALSCEEWIAFLTYVPTQEAIKESLYVGQEMAAKALEKSKLLVSFPVTPAQVRPKLTNLVAVALTSKNDMQLEPRFQEDDYMRKMELSSEELAAADVKEGMNVESTEDSFSPSKAQWSSLVRRVDTLTLELGMA
jgi:hypothetical protein